MVFPRPDLAPDHQHEALAAHEAQLLRDRAHEASVLGLTWLRADLEQRAAGIEEIRSELRQTNS